MNNNTTPELDRRRFRGALIKVLGIQAVALLVLWLLQRSFS